MSILLFFSNFFCRISPVNQFFSIYPYIKNKTLFDGFGRQIGKFLDDFKKRGRISSRRRELRMKCQIDEKISKFLILTCFLNFKFTITIRKKNDKISKISDYLVTNWLIFATFFAVCYGKIYLLDKKIRK